MNIIRKTSLIIFISSIYVATMKAMPALPQQCSAFKPLILMQSTVKMSEADKLAHPKKIKKDSFGQVAFGRNTYWVAWSDRSHNTTYESPDASVRCGELNFEEEVRIAEIQNGFALVYQEATPGRVVWPAISRGSVCKGWVPMDNLLLWSDCPTNDYGIYNKALIMLNLDEAVTDQSTVGQLYSNPETKDGKTPLRPSANFFFVMKEDHRTGMILLGKEVRVGGNIKALYGWVAPNMFSPWSQRTCLEPNWDDKLKDDLRGAIPVMTDKGRNVTSIPIFDDNKKNRVNNPSTAYRMDPRVLRYPLLECVIEKKGRNVQRELCHLTAFVNPTGGSQTYTLDDAAGEMEKYEQRLAELNNVNIILVIDGGKGMKDFYTYVEKAISNVYESLKQNGRQVKVGVVIYRGYEDGQFKTEVLTMCSPKDSRFLNFMATGGSYGIKNAEGKGDYDALYEGINTALDANKLGYNLHETVLMLVVGDCGNNPDSQRGPTQEEIVKKLVENNIQLSSFHVNNIQNPPYQAFHRQMSQIVIQNIKRQYAAVNSDIKATFEEFDEGNYDVLWKEDPEHAFFIGGFRCPQNGKTMDKERLYAQTKIIANRVKKALDIHKELLDEARQKYSTGSNPQEDQAFSEIDKAFITNWTQKNGIDLNALSQMNLILAIEGYAPQRNGQGLDYWKPVIYISRKEYDNLMTALTPVVNTVQGSPDERKEFVEAMKGLVRAMLPDKTEEEMNRMGNEEIMQLIFGLNVTTDALNYSLTDIQSEQKVSQEKFREIVSHFIEKYQRLQDIYANDYPFSTKRQGMRWYWIPVEDLP